MSDFVDNSPAGGETPASTPSPATQGTPAPQAATPPAPGSAPTPQPQEATVPSYRLRETREQYERQIAQRQSQWQAQEAQYRAQLEAIQRQLHAVVGVNPPSQEEQEFSAIRNQFSKVFPELAALNERAKDVMGLLDRSGDYDAALQHQWQSYGRNAVDRLFGLAEKSMGSPLTDEGKSILYTAFSGYVGSSPELTQRYASDPSMIEEFWKAYEANFIAPARRVQQAQVQQQVGQPRAFPKDTPAPIAPAAAPPKPKDLDERVATAWAAFNAHKNANKA